MLIVPESLVIHGQFNGLEDVRSKLLLQKGRSVSCPIVWVPCLWAEVTATSPTLPNGMQRSRVNRKSRVQLDKVMSYPPLLSHAVDFALYPPWNGEAFLPRTSLLCSLHCKRWRICHWKGPLSGIQQGPYVERYDLIVKYFFMWSHTVDDDTPSSDYCIRDDSTADRWMVTVNVVLC